jgi:predicted RNA binding protein YcfA (HicA-like mRNA interferase family)
MLKMTAREVIRRLTADGWYELRRKPGSHRHFKHPAKPGKIQVADHKGRDIPQKTLDSIAEISGVPMR